MTRGQFSDLPFFVFIMYMPAWLVGEAANIAFPATPKTCTQSDILSMTDKHCARKYSGSAAKCEIFEINLRNALRNLRNNLRTIINRPLEWERSLRGFGTLRKNNIFFLNRPLESERSLRGFGTLRKNTFL